MDDEGRFIYTKPEPKPEQAEGGEGEEDVSLDTYAGTDIDASQMGQMQEQMMTGNQEGESKPQENPPATRNKPSMCTGPDKRFTGLPREAGNENVDKRTERRVG